MLKKILANLGVALLLLLGQSAYAGSGLLFNVAASGTPGNVSVNLCLNGKGPLSCQDYNLSALILNISPAVPNHVYPAIGIKINTPGYTLANLGIDCTPVTNGYCLFSASQAAPKTIIIKSSNTPTANTVGGTITGLAGTVALLNNGTNSTSISTDGKFAFSTPIAEGSPYAVTVQTQPANQTCTVNNASGTMGNSPVTNVTLTCSTNAYTVGGTITGLSGGTLTLLNNGVDAISKTANGSFTFPISISHGSTYNVTVQSPQPTNQTCSVTNGSGTMGSGPVTNITVTCSTNAYTVGGTIAGLSSGTLTLLNNGGDAISETANVSFTFPTPVAQGSAYNVTVQLPQPTGQRCTIIGGSGMMGSGPVSSVSVSCSAIPPTTITVTSTGIIPYTGSSLSQDLTVTNTGLSPAYDVLASLPGGWTGVTQNATGCATISPNGGTCTLSFTSTTPYVAQGGIVVSGDNTNSATTALAFSVGGYLVWSVDSSTSVSVIDTNDLSSEQWGNLIITNAQSLTDGIVNTSTINGTPSITPSAAVNCYNSTAGGATVSTWYLPAICQMGGANQGAGCSSNLANIDTNLVQLGFGGLAGFYWSSTEDSVFPQNDAELQFFASGGGSAQYTANKVSHGVRCSRALSL
ncbi:MAG: hypothetical protein P4M14_13560 [Gammaproteobacteria bacterium]|nr:hypothetical protein [Gammaproteobacteria bacterium]